MLCSAAARCATRMLQRHRQCGPDSTAGSHVTLVVARRFVVNGKVQGVFFRASTVRMAEQLGVRGFARNLPDGSVEVLALGDSASLVTLAGWLRKGPPLALVTSVTEQEEDAARYAGVRDFRTA